jgi:hypothetical protein
VRNATIDVQAGKIIANDNETRTDMFFIFSSFPECIGEALRLDVSNVHLARTFMDRVERDLSPLRVQKIQTTTMSAEDCHVEDRGIRV